MGSGTAPGKGAGAGAGARVGAGAGAGAGARSKEQGARSTRIPANEFLAPASYYSSLVPTAPDCQRT